MGATRSALTIAILAALLLTACDPPTPTFNGTCRDACKARYDANDSCTEWEYRESWWQVPLNTTMLCNASLIGAGTPTNATCVNITTAWENRSSCECRLNCTG